MYRSYHYKSTLLPYCYIKPRRFFEGFFYFKPKKPLVFPIASVKQTNNDIFLMLRVSNLSKKSKQESTLSSYSLITLSSLTTFHFLHVNKKKSDSKKDLYY
jgi:hypothetical protein